jgi:RimJ/RimL family protein N-acetyltransferase
MNLQPILENEMVSLHPLKPSDFDVLYAVASDPLIWIQHPNPDRYKMEVFETFFKGALESGGAFLISDASSGKAIGSTRYYDYDGQKSQVLIGYTFFARDHWGTTYNKASKTLMLNHAFDFVDSVLFHIGAENKRSQIAIERLGAKKTKEIEVEYYGEVRKLNFEYVISKDNWMK